MSFIQEQLSSAMFSGLNVLIGQQKSLRDLITPHTGKSALFEIPIVGLRISFVVDDTGGLQHVSPDSLSRTDVTLVYHGGVPNPPFNISSLMRSLSIEGNVDFADALSKLIQTLEIQPGDWLHPLLGDIVTARIEGVLDLLKQKLFHQLPSSQSLQDCVLTNFIVRSQNQFCRIFR